MFKRIASYQGIGAEYQLLIGSNALRLVVAAGGALQTLEHVPFASSREAIAVQRRLAEKMVALALGDVEAELAAAGVKP